MYTVVSINFFISKYSTYEALYTTTICAELALDHGPTTKHGSLFTLLLLMFFSIEGSIICQFKMPRKKKIRIIEYVCVKSPLKGLFLSLLGS
jgi:hypothetical protein